jgi:hypothetical protein
MTDEQLANLTLDQFTALMRSPTPPAGYENSPGWRLALWYRSAHLRPLPRAVFQDLERDEA